MKDREAREMSLSQELSWIYENVKRVAAEGQVSVVVSQLSNDARKVLEEAGYTIDVETTFDPTEPVGWEVRWRTSPRPPSPIQ
jgi:hypothetical protein